jgi:hypothetical protein
MHLVINAVGAKFGGAATVLMKLLFEENLSPRLVGRTLLSLAR